MRKTLLNLCPPALILFLPALALVKHAAAIDPIHALKPFSPSHRV